MTDFIQSAYSNDFVVKDYDTFAEATTKLPLFLYQVDAEKEPNRVYFFDEDGNGIPTYVWDEEINDEVEVNIVDMIAPHLVDGEVAIFTSVGSEGLRYITGSALAFNNKQEVREICLDNIHNLAEELR